VAAPFNGYLVGRTGTHALVLLRKRRFDCDPSGWSHIWPRGPWRIASPKCADLTCTRRRGRAGGHAVSRASLPPTRAATNAGSGRLGAIRCFENVASARSNPNFQRRAMALSGLRVKEYLDRASGQSTKNYICSARHGRFLLRSLDYHSVVTQAQEAEKPGWANYRAQHLARTPFGSGQRSQCVFQMEQAGVALAAPLSGYLVGPTWSRETLQPCRTSRWT
jgi:hypothetical protein